MMTSADDASYEGAQIAARLAYENLRRLGATCADAKSEYQRLARERDTAVMGVARWGYSHRQLADAARITPQRVGQILAGAPRARVTRLP